MALESHFEMEKQKKVGFSVTSEQRKTKQNTPNKQTNKRLRDWTALFPSPLPTEGLDCTVLKSPSRCLPNPVVLDSEIARHLQPQEAGLECKTICAQMHGVWGR